MNEMVFLSRSVSCCPRTKLWDFHLIALLVFDDSSCFAWMHLLCPVSGSNHLGAHFLLYCTFSHFPASYNCKSDPEKGAINTPQLACCVVAISSAKELKPLLFEFSFTQNSKTSKKKLRFCQNAVWMASYIIPCEPGFHCHTSVAVSSLWTLPEFPIKLYLQHSRTSLTCRSKRFPIPPVKKFQRVPSHTVRPITTATPLLIPVFCIHCCSCQCDQMPWKK